MRRLVSHSCTNLWRIVAACWLCIAHNPTVRSACISRKYEVFPKHVGCLEPSPVALQPRGVNLGDLNTILSDLTNIRAEVTASDMLVLTWDLELASLAQRWAENCNATRDENLSVPGRFASVGQIVASGLSNWRTAIAYWGGTRQSFTYGNSSVMAYDTAVAYAQLVWASSSIVGCGFSTCAGIGKFYVCNFAPGYPMRSNYAVPYTMGTPCSACQGWCSSASDTDAATFCGCGTAVCQNGGTLLLNSCTCKCAYAHTTGPSCGLNCSGIADPTACSTRTARDCQTVPAVTVQCPNLCQLCPYAAADYKPPTQDAATTASNPSVSPAAERRAGIAVLGLCALAARLAVERHNR